MARARRYSDDQLSAAVVVSKSWRGVLRELGLLATSSAAMHSVRSQADRLRLDYSHFVGQRGWTEQQLRTVITEARSWRGVAEAFGLDGSADVRLLQGHALRLRLDTTHLTVPTLTEPSEPLRPTLEHLDRAGPLLAAAWFTLCGLDVSWPLEPSRYDLLVTAGAGIRRVQVKTTSTRAGDSWKVYLSTSRGGRTTYGPDEVDDFFIVDGDFAYYLIPLSEVGGLHAIHLRRYERFRQMQMPFERQVVPHGGPETFVPAVLLPDDAAIRPRA